MPDGKIALRSGLVSFCPAALQQLYLLHSELKASDAFSRISAKAQPLRLRSCRTVKCISSKRPSPVSLWQLPRKTNQLNTKEERWAFYQTCKRFGSGRANK